MNFLNNKSILITGGTGSFGKKFVEIVLQKYKPKKIIIYSRDEQKQFQLQLKWKESDVSPIRYFIGDVRDLDRLKFAMQEVQKNLHPSPCRPRAKDAQSLGRTGNGLAGRNNFLRSIPPRCRLSGIIVGDHVERT